MQRGDNNTEPRTAFSASCRLSLNVCVYRICVA